MKNKKSLVKKYKSGGTQMPFTLPAVYNPYYGVSEYGDGGRVWKDIGAGAYGAGSGLASVLTGGATTPLTDMGYQALQKSGNSTEDEIRQQNSIAGYGKAAGAITGAALGMAPPEAAIGVASQGIGEGISYGSANDPNAQMAGSMVTSLGKLGSMAAGQGMGSTGMTGGSNANMLTMINPSMNTGVPNTMSPQQAGMMARYGGMKYALGGVIKTPYDNKIAITDIRMFGNGGLSSGMQRVWDNPNKKPLFVNSLQMFKNGGQIVAELEGGENYIKASDGGFVQLPDSAPSHEEGGVKLTEQQIPSGSIIFSDKLKVPGTNKTFAEMNKKNDTSKLDKKFDKLPVNQASINAKEELRKAMMLNSQNLFADQELLKQRKVDNYAKRLGLIKSNDNERSEPMGLPEGNEGEYAMARMGGMYMAGGQMMVPTVNDYMRDEDYNSLTYANGGKLPEGLLRSRLEAHMSPEEASNYIANYANGGMIKRADGSYSQRGLWDNIRANAGSGKQPTKEMLEQEAKINAKYEKGGIHINPANKGKFTASAERAGMGVQEFARHVLANSEDYSSTQVKRANFARNAAGWKHEMGSVQMYADGGNTGQNSNTGLYGTNLYTESKMSPQEWDKYNTGMGYAKIPGKGQFASYYNPKEYTPDENFTFTKIGDLGKTVNYSNDPTYKPIMQYGYTEPVQAPKQYKTIPTLSNRTAVDTNEYFKTYKDANNKTSYYDIKTNQPIDTSKSFQGGKYNPFFINEQVVSNGQNPGVKTMAYGGYMENGGKTPPYQPLSKTDSMNVTRLINMPKYDLNKFNFEVERIYNKKGDEVDANIYRVNLKTGKRELENESWKTNPLHHKALNEVVARQNISKGQDLNATPQFFETYQKSLEYMPEVSKKRYGGINYNNESIIQYRGGGTKTSTPVYDASKFVDDYDYSTSGLGNVPQGVTEVRDNSIADFGNRNDFNQSLTRGINEFNAGDTGVSSTSGSKDYSGLINAGTQIGMGLLQNAGNIYDIYRGSKPETETYERYTPTTLTANEVLRGNQLGYAAGKQGLAASSQGSGSAYRQNLKDLALKKMYADAKAIENVNNLNAGIRNQAGMFNTQLSQQEVIANLQNKAKARDLTSSGISGVGKNVSSQIRDYRTGSMDQKTLNAIIASNPQWANSAEGKAYIAKFKK